MDLPADSVELIRQWAARTDSVREVWLFGSRAKGTSRPDSDVDIGIYLMPPAEGADWALALYTAEGDAWQRELGGLNRAARSIGFSSWRPLPMRLEASEFFVSQYSVTGKMFGGKPE